MKANAKPIRRYRIKSNKYSSAFIEVARQIAKADPPLWVLVGLTHFSSLGNDTSKQRQFLKQTAGKMSDAAALLLRWLPVWEQLGYGIQCPDQVKAVLVNLPKVKADLDRRSIIDLRKKTVRREICAAVVVEARQLLNIKVERRSEEDLYRVCNAYWCACGGEEIGETGDPSNWRRAVKVTTYAEWVRLGLLALQSMPELQAPLAVQNPT